MPTIGVRCNRRRAEARASSPFRSRRRREHTVPTLSFDSGLGGNIFATSPTCQQKIRVQSACSGLFSVSAPLRASRYVLLTRQHRSNTRYSCSEARHLQHRPVARVARVGTSFWQSPGRARAGSANASSTPRCPRAGPSPSRLLLPVPVPRPRRGRQPPRRHDVFGVFVHVFVVVARVENRRYADLALGVLTTAFSLLGSLYLRSRYYH